LKNKNIQPFFFFVFQNRGCQSRLIQNKIFIFFGLKETHRLLSCYFFLHFPPKAPEVSSIQILFYTMATPSLKCFARKGASKTSGDTPVSSDNEGTNPNANDAPTFFIIKHYKWILQYQQLFQFYLVNGHTNVTRRNADNSLAEWASYQRSKMGAVGKYDPKWKQLLNGIGFCCSPHPPKPGVRESYGVLQCPQWNLECNYTKES
jgi:hypothetical protein